VDTIAAMPRIYRRTDAGTRAWDTQDPRVPLECRRVLGLVRHDTDPKHIEPKLGLSERALADILDELEELGLLSSFDMTPDRTDLDFTGKFTIAELLKAAHEDLDFTGSMSVDSLRAGAKKPD
jgi:hypothetical protein